MADEYKAKDSPSELGIVLVGRTGAGKSAAGNTILGEREFKSRFVGSCVTKACEKRTGVVSGRSVAVIDTPGLLFDTKLSPNAVKQEIAKCISLTTPGRPAFLLVIKLGHFTEEEKKTIQQIEKIFDVKHTLLLFTHGDKLKNTKIEKFLEDTDEDFQQLVKKYGNRYHVFNNENMSDRTQVTELLQKIDRMVKEEELKEKKQNKLEALNKRFEEAKLKLREGELKQKEKEWREQMKRELEEEWKIMEEELKREREAMEKKQQEEQQKMEEEMKQREKKLEEKMKRELEEERKIKEEELKKEQEAMEKKQQEEQKKREEEMTQREKELEEKMKKEVEEERKRMEEKLKREREAIEKKGQEEQQKQETGNELEKKSSTQTGETYCSVFKKIIARLIIGAVLGGLTGAAAGAAGQGTAGARTWGLIGSALGGGTGLCLGIWSLMNFKKIDSEKKKESILAD